MCRHLLAVVELDYVGNFADNVYHSHIVLGLHTALRIEAELDGLSHYDATAVGA